MRKSLPTDRDARSRVLRAGVDLARSARNPLSVEWAMTYWYMQGVRNFQIQSWRDGRFRWSYESPEGQLQLRLEDIVKQYQRQLGLLQKIDVRPACDAKGQGLKSFSDAAIAQAVLNHMTQSINLPAVHLDSCQIDLMYGTGALALTMNPDVSLLGATPCVYAVPPWQVLPDPARPMRREEVHGVFYHRWVPYRWCKEYWKDRLRFPKLDEEEPLLNLRWLAIGERIDHNDSVLSQSDLPVRGSLSGMSLGQDQGRGPANEEDEPWVEVIEYWNYDENQKVEHYEVLLGHFLATKDDFKTYQGADKPCLPIGVFGCQLAGGFYNRGWVPLLIPANIELEKCYSSLFKNVQELDNFGWLTIPNTLGIKDEELDAKGRPRRIRYEPDYSTPYPLAPGHIAPYSSGDFPGRVAASAVQLLDRLGNASDLLSGKPPGRVDSASGLGLLYETFGIQTIPMGESLNQAWTTIYRAMLQQAPKFLKGKKTLPLLEIDDELAGIMLDPSTGEMVLSEENPIPHPDDVMISIKDKQPTQSEKMREDLAVMKQSQQIDPLMFAWYSYKNNLKIPAGYETEIEEIRKCQLRNVMQWNGGKVPGQVVASALDMHDIQLKWMKRFMARPRFQFGSKDVRDAFEQRFQFHQNALGGFPQQMPYPEDMGEQAASPDQWGPTGDPNLQGLPPQLAGMLQQADAGQPPPGGE